MAAVAGWSTRYDSDAAAEVATRAAEGTRTRRPPSRFPPRFRKQQPLAQPDVTIAAWIGAVEALSTPVDQLAEKSLRAIWASLRRWTESGGSWPTPRHPRARRTTKPSTLSADQLRARLSSPNDDRLVRHSTASPMSLHPRASIFELGNTFIVFVRNRAVSFDPLDESQDPRQVQRSMQLDWGDKFVLHPAEMVLAATFEYLSFLPSDLSAQVISRSSYGRLGLLSATAVQVHPALPRMPNA